MTLRPGGSLTIINAPDPTITFRRSADGTTVGFGVDGEPPAELDIAFLRYLLQLCGYIVMAREDIAGACPP